MLFPPPFLRGGPVTSEPVGMPVYMQGMAGWDVRSLSGAYTPSNGNEVMYDVVPTEWKTFEGVTSTPNVFRAWSGGKGDATNRRLFVHGGGHADSANNGLYVFDLSGDSAPVGWTLQTNSLSAVADIQASANTYDDGKPTSIHSYDGLVYEPTLDRFYRCGGSAHGPGGGGCSICAYYDFDTDAWVTLVENSVIGGTLSSSLIVSPDGTQLLYLSSTKQPQFINTSTGALTGHGTTPWNSEEKGPCTCYDSLRDRYLTIYLSTSTILDFAVNWGAKTWSSNTRTLTGTHAGDIDADGACVFYDAARDLIWVFGNRTAADAGSIDFFYSIHPTTYAVTRFALNSGISMGSGSKGGYNRFVWFPEWRIVATVQLYDQPVHLIKIPAS